MTASKEDAIRYVEEQSAHIDTASVDLEQGSDVGAGTLRILPAKRRVGILGQSPLGILIVALLSGAYAVPRPMASYSPDRPRLPSLNDVSKTKPKRGGGRPGGKHNRRIKQPK